MQDTLAQDWRKRMAARSTVCAMLLAIPVLTAVLIGFSAGPGGLPFGISSLASGPSEPLQLEAQPASSQALGPVSTSAPAAGSGFAAPSDLGSPSGGGSSVPGSGGGVNDVFSDEGSGINEVGPIDDPGEQPTGPGPETPPPPSPPPPQPPIALPPGTPEPSGLLDMAEETLGGLLGGNPPGRSGR
jgi:hypothetical protein